jgi:flagella basal body P-ring formation protein FlgA
MKSAKVVVAARNLKKGAVVASKYIKLLRVAKQESLSTILDPRLVVGAKLRMALAQNRPILPRMLIKN